MCWPVEQGGQGRNLLYQFLFVEEMEYWGMPYGNLTYTSIGPSIQHFGSEEQKRRWLPGHLERRVRVRDRLQRAERGHRPRCAAHARRARRRRVGDQRPEDLDLARRRRDPHLARGAHRSRSAQAPGHLVFVVPTDVQGLTIRPLHAMYGGHTCETFYDDVRVPHDNLVGGLNKGWGIVMHALNHERVGLAATGGLARLFDQLVAYLAEAQPEKLRDAVVRRRLAELALDLHEHRALALRNAWIIAKGGTPIAEASMAKVSGTELRTRIANTAMDLLGRYGALSKESGELAPAEGRMEWAFRIAPIFRSAAAPTR
jgi:alkylation response protein AidB-like acyl-CoA dehydrogenase